MMMIKAHDIWGNYERLKQGRDSDEIQLSFSLPDIKLVINLICSSS